ncbi:hypothetical protein CC86DRAFT_374790 [Ophiobolus disseminans]|uniref:Rhodopsin domain-containing protein n=1 Tax=Ophiobolus disseminans TaxID=1469910 RepID=A0A6A6ZIQ9_9PLEO|nr:hypothetical protein CC86DRAFT_374790 [Ophiobolus disseminans]
MTSNDTIIGTAPAPFGVTPNFANPESIAYRVIIACILGPAIAIPICIIRLYTKRYILRNTGYDDYAIVLATILALGCSINTGIQTRNGLGNHIWDVPTYKFRAFMKLGNIAGPLTYNLATLFIKLSLCLFYLRFSPSKSFRIAVYAVMTVSVAYSLPTAFGFAWVCHPVAKYWDFTIKTGYCINVDGYFLGTTCVNAALDLALLVLPLFIIKDLRLPIRQKIGVALLLMTGSFVCVISLIRLEAVVRGMHTNAVDGTWGMVTNFIWLLVEMWLGIVCTCLPTLHAFMRRRTIKRERNAKNDHDVVRGRRHHRLGPNLASESQTFEDMRQTSFGPLDSDTDMHGISGVRPIASNKSLLTTVSTREG